MRERNRILRVVVTALLLYALGSFAAARGELAQQRADNCALEEQRQVLLQQRQELEDRLALAEDPRAMRRLAWEKLRMVMPQETVFAFTQSR